MPQETGVGAIRRTTRQSARGCFIQSRVHVITLLIVYGCTKKIIKMSLINDQAWSELCQSQLAVWPYKSYYQFDQLRGVLSNEWVGNYVECCQMSGFGNPCCSSHA